MTQRFWVGCLISQGFTLPNYKRKRVLVGTKQAHCWQHTWQDCGHLMALEVHLSLLHWTPVLCCFLVKNVAPTEHRLYPYSQLS